MAKYEKDIRYYWLQLKEDFFDEDSISWLEDQENGEKYALFYLKLCLKSLKTQGILIRKVGDMLVPYDRKKIAELTRTDVDTVTVGMKLFEKIGLVQILENGEIYLTQIQDLIGQKTRGAFKKQQQRLLNKGGQLGGQKGDNCPPELELELELELEQELDKVYQVVKFYEDNFGPITPIEFEIYQEYIKDGFKVDTIIYAMELAVKRKKQNTAYVEGILKNWERKNIKTLVQAKNENNEYESKKEEKNKTEEKAKYKEVTFENEEEYQRKVLGK